MSSFWTSVSERLLRDPAREAAAAQELHRDVRRAVLVLGELEDGDDVPVLEAGGGAGLAEEAGARGLVGREVARHDLDGDLAIEHGILAAVEHTHPAASHPLDDLVASELPGNFDHGRSCYLGAGASSMTSRYGPIATGTPARMHDAIDAPRVHPGPVLAVQVDEHVPAGLGPQFRVEPRHDLVGIVEHHVVLLAPADLQFTPPELDVPVQRLVAKDDEP